MRRRPRFGRVRLAGLAGVMTALALSAVHASWAQAGDVAPPTQWPSAPGAAPEIETWSNAIRFAGPNREQTALALALGLRGAGDYPFDTVDPSSAGAQTLATADDWWGVGTCPRAIIVVAGDTPADSLAASALSDPTDNSSEPFLQRSAAADPLFDPIGGFTRVDTEAAPILVTRSARQGAAGLGASARIAARDVRSGGCRLARQAIIVGGTAAVPAAADAELVALGYDEVFRVAGPNRYATAGTIASALGTGASVTPGQRCDDPAVNDGTARMGFYANAAIELRASATSCRVLGRTVVVAEGVTGADALAAGWWTSFWQVPVLLHDGDATLPPATVGALTTLPIDHVVVLGGTARISNDIVDDIENVTGASVQRISGVDRYATSVEMAQRLGGWWPTGRAKEYSGSMVCLAASSGSGVAGAGWPDALAAGPWCAAANSAAAGRGAPVRAMAPLTGGQAAATASPSVRPAHDAVPVLLVPAGARELPDEVEGLLSSAFDQNDNFCSSVQAAPGCVVPGFIVAAGGAAVLPSPLIASAAQLVAGGAPSSGATAPTALTSAFLTSLDLSPVYDALPTPAAVCVPRDGYIDSRWLVLRAGSTSMAVIGEKDLMLGGRYVRERGCCRAHAGYRCSLVRQCGGCPTAHRACRRSRHRRADRDDGCVLDTCSRSPHPDRSSCRRRARQRQWHRHQRRLLERRVEHADVRDVVARHRPRFTRQRSEHLLVVAHVDADARHRPSRRRRCRPVFRNLHDHHPQWHGHGFERGRGGPRRQRVEPSRPNAGQRRHLERDLRSGWFSCRPRHRGDHRIR